MNQEINTIHPIVPNICTLMSLIPPEKQVCTVLDLKDAFFILLLAEVSQPIFDSKWADPERGYVRQHSWTRLPQDLKTLNVDFLPFCQRFLGKN